MHADADIELDFLAVWFAFMRQSLRQIGFATVPRKGGVQAMVHVNGRIVMPMGGGVTTNSGKGSAFSASVVSDMDRCHDEVRRFVALVVANKEKVLSEAKARGVDLQRPIRLNLHVNSDSVAIATTSDNAFGFPIGRLWRQD